MRLTLALILTLLLTTCTADYIVVNTRCHSWDPKSCERVDSFFHFNGGRQSVNGNHGCRNSHSRKLLISQCLNYETKRGHFLFMHQDIRCLRLLPKITLHRCGHGWFRCWSGMWAETPCLKEREEVPMEDIET
ncbi:hypothetical protein BDP81DRAFT_16655 [Colletotrichum phormii]|uniref:Cyanovirin-N domain-containing protein n=1 Tax=Colletotrichum phormii TaxID=359342 RepID=A0AAJ0A6V5_9PEZI|nr:uncharacterized protein BDP81DRAFT_16655 [Colletotrichum phormii]KAK1656171.1 hypothetical protein BDP81DRAFT_16655 [Colletotrichum phormii]